MPSLISVIVPAFDVQGYLTECLSSVLPPATDVEVIGVDDASPDHCGELLDERAAADPRLSALHLADNKGPGLARNAGLARATGEYVWFVDGDDYVAAGAFPAIAARLAEEKPDVLVVGVAQEQWNRKVARWRTPGEVSVGPRALTVDAPPLGALVVRRQFLVEAGIAFRPGWYEDRSFGYAVLAQASTVATLEPACYVWRSGRDRALRSARSARHADVVAQLDHALSLPALAGADPAVRRRAADRAVAEALRVLDGGRLPESARPALFARIGELAAKHGSAALGSYATYRVKRGVRRLADLAIRKPRRRLGWAAGRLRRAALRAYYLVELRRPMDENLAVYAAYWYRGYACNPAAIYERAKELAPHVRGVWVVKPGGTVPAGVEHVVAGTRAYFRTLARAKYLINNATFPPYVVKRKGSIHVQTHHGTPLKTMGLDQPRFPASLGNFDVARMRRNIAKWDFSITANRHTTLLWDRQFPIKGETLETGYPRNDRLARATAADTAAARAELGIAANERVVLYAPTHREWHPTFTPVLDVDALADALGPDTRILLRGHYFYNAIGFPPRHPRVLDVSGHPSVETLAIASDVLITDFSSVMFDYAVLDRPLVIFAPDWEVYRAVRGVTFDLSTEHAGVFARSFDELVEAFRTGAIDDAPARAMRARFRQRFCSLEDGHAAERVVRRVLLDERA